ncbi:ATP-binding protein [Halomonas sp. CKK8]|uniref:ATP-binding protein n=1 Tax=Halomonas sp. CKK8 TaxID=3036127 RepID=UPI0024152F9C|nr:ATP-binding protein [Halomonas sp. CKK8]WFM70500.1 ATP-binding protein [Halomonas sp. CKK8]
MSDSLTFGDMVASGDSEDSLLKHMAAGWVAAGEPAEVWLLTNRQAGTQKHTPKGAGSITRPSLADFITWMSAESKRAATLSAMKVKPEWKGAWDNLWLPQLEDIKTDAKKLAFLKALEVRHSEPELPEVRRRLLERIEKLFALKPAVCDGLLARLDSALRIWATSDRGEAEAITKEAAYEKLCLEEDTIVGDHDFPPPAPFFPSRIPAVDDVVELLRKRDTPVVFVSGEPGSGKTALLSHLANRRDPVIDARFHAYRPITPENQLLPADSEVTKPRSLWSDLLIKLRPLARGRLFELQVPVHAGSLSVEELRAHVLRIANMLGEAEGRPFVIAVDGIDHAARAGEGPDTFLASLVPPDQIPEHVTFLIGGQPSEAYLRQYPDWLRHGAAGVEMYRLPRLGLDDVRALIGARLNVNSDLANAVARDIHTACEGHTLSTVFAVEEARLLGDEIDGLSSLLANRRLTSGVEGYYKAIWLATTREFVNASALRLAACLTLARSRTTPKMLRAVVDPDGTMPVNWMDVLRALRPLVVEESQGFRVFHNDFRVFLHGVLRGDPDTYRESASLLGDFLRDGDDPLARHAAVQALYGIAERPRDQASVFEPSWVLEGHAIGRGLDILTEQAVTAAEALAAIKPDWSLAHQVAAGLKTLEQLRASLQWRDGREDIDSAPSGAISPRGVERAVPAKPDWIHDRVVAAINDVLELCDLGETERARAAFERWFAGLSPKEIADSARFGAGTHEHQQQDAARSLLAGLGRASAATTTLLECSQGTGWESAEASYAQGLLDSADGFAVRDQDFAEVLHRIQQCYLIDVEKLLWRLIDSREWCRCGLVLQAMSPQDCHPWYLRVSGAVAAAILGDGDLQERWTKPVLADRSSAIAASIEHVGTGLDEPSQITVMVRLAVLFGITDPNRHASGLREEIEKVYHARDRRDERHDAGVKELLHAAALLGSLIRTTREDLTPAIHCDPATVARTVNILLTAVDRHPYRIPFGYPQIAALIVKGILDCASGHSELTRAICVPLLDRIAERRTLGPMLTPVWRFLAQATHRQELLSYADAWVGSHGVAWTLPPAERHQFVTEFASLLQEIGENEAAEPALIRLPWANIGYTGHKDYSLSQALAWFREAAAVNARAWEDQGLRLFSLSREATRTGDNRVGGAIETAVLSAACVDGPSAIARIALTTETALEVGDDALVYALLRMVETEPLQSSELLSIWAFCIGQLCWRVHADRQVLADARDALLAAAQRGGIGHFDRDLRLMGAAEFACQRDPDTTSSPIERDTPDYSSLKPVDAITLAPAHQDWKQVAASLDDAKAEGGGSYAECIKEAWAALERREEQIWWFDGASDAYEHLFPLVTPEQRWDAVRRAVLADHFLSPEARINTIQENLDAMCLLVASHAGQEELFDGANRLLDMHTLWIEGGGRLPPLSPIPVDASSDLATWPEVLLANLLRSLEFDEQTYAQGALRGVFGMLRSTPTLLNQLVERASDSHDHVAQRLLLIAEAVVAEAQGESLNECLARLMAEAPRLDTALSAWGALLVAARTARGADPSWPKPTENPPFVIASSAPLISGPSSRTGLHTSAGRPSLSFLSFLRTACDESLKDVESDFASSVRNDPPSPSRSRRRARGSGDYVLNPKDEAENARLFEVLRKHDRQGRFSDVDVARLSQALAPAADPFVFLRTPAPHTQACGWPIDDDLDEWVSEPPEKLAYELAALLSSDLPDNIRVLGGSVTSYSREWDVKVHMHHRLPSSLAGDREPPRVLNARTSLMLQDFDVIFGPGSDDGWLTWGVYGLFPFVDGLVDVFPSPKWRQLGWQPSPSDPTRWLREGVIVAWHERLLGPVRRVYGGDLIYRHPVLTRWVCTSDEWSRLCDELGEPEPCYYPARARCDHH